MKGRQVIMLNILVTVWHENDECYKDLLRHGPRLADQIKTSEVVFIPEQMHTQWAACRQLAVRQCGEF